jgi:hypothetical protein
MTEALRHKIFVIGLIVLTLLMVGLLWQAKGHAADVGPGKLDGYLTTGKLWDMDYSTSTPSDNDVTQTISLSSPKARYLMGGEIGYQYKAVRPFVNYFALTGLDDADTFTIKDSLFSVGTDVMLYSVKSTGMGIRVQYADWMTSIGDLTEHKKFVYTGLIVKF